MAGKGKIYVGTRLFSGEREIFRSEKTPTERSHGQQYSAVIGPFRTMRGAEFMMNYGKGNPHIQTVGDAERLAKKYADQPGEDKITSKDAALNARLEMKPNLRMWQEAYEEGTGRKGRVTNVWAEVGRIGGAAIWVKANEGGKIWYYSPYFNQSAFDEHDEDDPGCPCDGCQIDRDAEAFVWMMEGATDWGYPGLWEARERSVPSF